MLNVGIRRHIRGIIIVDKAVLQGGMVENQSAEEEQKRDEKNGCWMLRHYYFLAGHKGARIVLK